MCLLPSFATIAFLGNTYRGGKSLEREHANSKIKEKFEDWEHFLVKNPFKDSLERNHLIF